jgi:1,6-anhydro-N-acetylmuramate kinase
VAEALDNLASIASRAARPIRTLRHILTTLMVVPVRSPQPYFHAPPQPLADLRAIGQTTRIERSSLEQVRARIAFLREKTKQASASKAYDFDQRLREIREKEASARATKKAERLAAKEKTRIELAKSTPMNVDSENVMSAMGFAGFGTSKK